MENSRWKGWRSFLFFKKTNHQIWMRSQKKVSLLLWQLAGKLDFFMIFQLLWAKLEFDINLFKLVNFQLNFETRVKVWSVLEDCSRDSTGCKKRQGGCVHTVYGGSAKTSVPFSLGRSGASRSKRPWRTTWKRTTWPQGMELTVVGEGKQTAWVLVLILRSHLRRNLMLFLLCQRCLLLA